MGIFTIFVLCYLNKTMEEIKYGLDSWLHQLGIADNYLNEVHHVVVILIILLVSRLLYVVCRKGITPLVKKLTAKTESAWDDYLLNDNVMNNACYLLPSVAMFIMMPLVFPVDSSWLPFLLKICKVYIIFVIIRLICSVLTSLYTISSEHEKLKQHSLKAFYQMMKLVVICVGVIVIISELIGSNPLAVLTGLGAGTAILMLVFQDTIKGLVAGVQLTANDMLRPGDWISMPKYGADGDVEEVTLTTVKVRNFDKTVTTVPPYALVNDSFQNWRGMVEAGGRRIKRSINIDMNSVRFCTMEEMNTYRGQGWMEGFIPTGKEEVNLCLFRHYMNYYLRHHVKVNQNLTLLVRQLQPTSQGIPIELYFFSASIVWVKYENLQAEVFDHVLAVLPHFGLRVFQSPSGMDLMEIKKEA